MDYTAIVTLLAAGSAFLVYYLQRRHKRRDAARIILQEIRRAESIIQDYVEFDEFRFTKKIIAVNSWSKNIHYFVDVLDVDELDAISNLYSTGEFLDQMIVEIIKAKFDKANTEYAKFLSRPAVEEKKPTKKKQQEPEGTKVLIPAKIPGPWDPILKDSIRTYQFIYNSPITQKLKQVAKLNK